MRSTGVTYWHEISCSDNDSNNNDNNHNNNDDRIDNNIDFRLFMWSSSSISKIYMTYQL